MNSAVTAGREPDAPFSLALRLVSRVFPNLEHFNLGTRASYGMPIPASFTMVSVKVVGRTTVDATPVPAR